jgi:hypothetical protein
MVTVQKNYGNIGIIILLLKSQYTVSKSIIERAIIIYHAAISATISGQ